MLKLICAICGKEFETQGGNVKYCSTECKREGQRQRRKEWEVRTGYKEKQRQAAAEYRAEQAKQAEQEEKEAVRKKKAAETKAKRKKERQEAAELAQRSKNGDKAALLKLALKNGNTLEYWRLRKEMILDEDERTGRISNNIIGGISVYAGEFEYQIMAVLEEKSDIIVGILRNNEFVTEVIS